MSVSPRSTDETRSSTPEIISAPRSIDLAHHKPTTTLAQSMSMTSDVGPSIRRNTDHRGPRQQLALEQRTFVPPPASTEASDPSQHRSPVWVKLDDRDRPSSRTSTVSGDEDGTVDVEELNVGDVGQTSVDDCLVTSLRAEVSRSRSVILGEHHHVLSHQPFVIAERQPTLVRLVCFVINCLFYLQIGVYICCSSKLSGCVQVEVLQRQLNHAMKLIPSQQHDRHSRSSQDGDRRQVDALQRASPSVDETRRRLEHALNEAENQLRAERERAEAAERQQTAATSLLSDKDVELSQLRDRLADVERQLADQIDKNTNIVDQLDTCRSDKHDLAQVLQLEKSKTSELEADVAHLRADLADVTERRGLETTNHLLREDLERVETRLKAVQLDNSQLKEARSVTEAAINNLKLELESATSALKLKDGNVRNLEETAKALRSEIGDLKSSLTQAENLAARTQTELVAVNSALEDELANAERLKRRLLDETTKSQNLEKTVVDLYAELESKDVTFETDAENSRIFRQEVEAKLRVSEEDNAKLRDLLRDAEKQVNELEEQRKNREKQLSEPGQDSARDGTKKELAEGPVAGESDAEHVDGGRRPLSAVTGVSVSADAPAAGVVSPGVDDALEEKYAVAVRRMQSLQRELRHAEARQAELEDKNALLRQQLANTESNHEETTDQLTAKVEQLSAQLETAESQLQHLKVY